MQLEVGAVLEGKVTGITKFGVFVGLPDGKTGMVHISEIAGTYVNEIRDFVTEGQEVKVKVLSLGDNGKINLSIKRAEETPRPVRSAPRNDRPFSNRPIKGGSGRPVQGGSSCNGFDDMLSSFLKSSDDKLSGMKKSGDRRGGGRRGGGRDDDYDYD